VWRWKISSTLRSDYASINIAIPLTERRRSLERYRLPRKRAVTHRTDAAYGATRAANRPRSIPNNTGRCAVVRRLLQVSPQVTPGDPETGIGEISTGSLPPSRLLARITSELPVTRPESGPATPRRECHRQPTTPNPRATRTLQEPGPGVRLWVPLVPLKYV